MQLAVPQRRYPTNINYTPRSLESSHSDNYSIVCYRGTASSDWQKQSDLLSEDEQAMAATVTEHTMKVPESAIRHGPKLLRKCRSLKLSHGSSGSFITRRHSWTPDNFPSAQDHSLIPSVMEVAEVRTFNEDMPQVQDSLLSNKRAFSSTRPGATFDMAYFLRNTGPPTGIRETARDDLKKAVRKRSRGIFRKRRDLPDSVAPAAEEQKATIFVPPEGVEQKFTARGNKYLHIVSHPENLDLGGIYSPQLFCNPKSDDDEVIGSDAIDTWIPSFEGQQHNDADFSVKPPTADDMRAHESVESPPPSRLGTPKSFVSAAQTVLRPSEGGFGLSIIDGPVMNSYFNGASDCNAALRSNPPSNPATPPHIVHGHNASIETAELPLIEKRIDSADCGNIDNVSVQATSEKLEEKEKYDRRSTDVLAGQGLRRPVRDEIVLTQSEADELPTISMQTRHHREAAVRARKLRDQQSTSRNIDDFVTDHMLQREAQPGQSDLPHVFANDLRPEALALYTGLPKHRNQLTKTMLVAEQAPLPRARPIRKPARLVLREGLNPYNMSAVRTEDNPVRSVDYSPYTSPLRQNKPNTPPEAPRIPAKSTARTTPTVSTSTANSFARHRSTPTLSSSLTPQAVTAIAGLGSGVRSSVCSSHTSHNKEARLEARLEALERENRLLEAALMAVLKTSGTLNRCPCIVLQDRTDTQVKNTEHASALRSPTLVASPLQTTTPMPKMASTELQRVREEDAKTVIEDSLSQSASSPFTNRGSMESNASGISALEVYLRTKIGA